MRRPRRQWCARQANRPGVRGNERIEKTIAKRAEEKESKERRVDWRAGLSYAAAFSLVISTVYFLFSLIFDRIKPVTCATLRTPPPVQTWACQGVRVERTSCVYVWVCVCGRGNTSIFDIGFSTHLRVRLLSRRGHSSGHAIKRGARSRRRTAQRKQNGRGTQNFTERNENRTK